jgi:hypothetical protein
MSTHRLSFRPVHEITQRRKSIAVGHVGNAAPENVSTTDVYGQGIDVVDMPKRAQEIASSGSKTHFRADRVPFDAAGYRRPDRGGDDEHEQRRRQRSSHPAGVEGE